MDAERRNASTPRQGGIVSTPWGSAEDAAWTWAEECKSMATCPPSRANLESWNARSCVLSPRNSSTTPAGRAVSRVTHAGDITSHTHIARASSSLGAFTSPVTPREERSERYKRAEWIAATQGAAVGCGGWTDKAELERRDVEDAMLIYASTTVMRATSRARQASRRSPESTARKPSFALLRFYLYRTQTQVCTHFLATAATHAAKDITRFSRRDYSGIALRGILKVSSEPGV